MTSAKNQIANQLQAAAVELVISLRLAALSNKASPATIWQIVESRFRRAAKNTTHCPRAFCANICAGLQLESAPNPRLDAAIRRFVVCCCGEGWPAAIDGESATAIFRLAQEKVLEANAAYAARGKES